jgi:hypothetical protein
METKGKAVVAMAGFVILGLSPSFVDWEQEPEKRPQMIAFYGVALACIWFGLFNQILR